MPEAPRAALVCRAGRPFACRLSLPLWCAMGWRAPAALAIPATVVLGRRFARQVAGAAGVGGAQRVVCPVDRLLTLPLACFLSPIPPAPFPAGRGEPQSLFRRGLRPRHPCTEPPTALIVPAKQVSGGCTPAAPLAGNLFLSVLRRTIGSAPGMQGAKPLA